MEVKIQAKEIGPSNWEAVISSPTTTVRRTMFGSSANRAIGNLVARHAEEYDIKYTTKEYGPSNWGATLIEGQASHTFSGQCENDAIGNTVERYGHLHCIEVVIIDQSQNRPSVRVDERRKS